MNIKGIEIKDYQKAVGREGVGAIFDIYHKGHLAGEYRDYGDGCCDVLEIKTSKEELAEMVAILEKHKLTFSRFKEEELDIFGANSYIRKNSEMKHKLESYISNLLFIFFEIGLDFSKDKDYALVVVNYSCKNQPNCYIPESYYAIDKGTTAKERVKFNRRFTDNFINKCSEPISDIYCFWITDEFVNFK